jgi:hypothetical protein
MNSHQRRTTDRRWPHAININNDDELLTECSAWLHTNYGSSRFGRKRYPRWCFRLNYDYIGLASYAIGAQIYFRKERDYLAFLLRWS